MIIRQYDILLSLCSENRFLSPNDVCLSVVWVDCNGVFPFIRATLAARGQNTYQSDNHSQNYQSTEKMMFFVIAQISSNDFHCIFLLQDAKTENDECIPAVLRQHRNFRPKVITVKSASRPIKTFTQQTLIYLYAISLQGVNLCRATQRAYACRQRLYVIYNSIWYECHL